MEVIVDGEGRGWDGLFWRWGILLGVRWEDTWSQWLWNTPPSERHKDRGVLKTRARKKRQYFHIVRKTERANEAPRRPPRGATWYQTTCLFLQPYQLTRLPRLRIRPEVSGRQSVTLQAIEIHTKRPISEFRFPSRNLITLLQKTYLRRMIILQNLLSISSPTRGLLRTSQRGGG